MRTRPQIRNWFADVMFLNDPTQANKVRHNPIPSEASTITGMRMLPNRGVEGFYAKLTALIVDPRVELVREKIYRPAAPTSDIDNETFLTLTRVANEMFPGAAVMQIMRPVRPALPRYEIAACRPMASLLRGRLPR